MTTNNDISLDSFYNEFIKDNDHSNYIKTIIAREQRFNETKLPQWIYDLMFNETTFIEIRRKVKNEIIHEIGIDTKYLHLIYEILRECIKYDDLIEEYSRSKHLDLIIKMFKDAIAVGEKEIKMEINPLYFSIQKVMQFT